MRWSSAIVWTVCAFLMNCGAVVTPCDTNQDCSTGEACINGSCVALCTADSHCPAGTICDGDTCVTGAREAAVEPEVQNEEPLMSDACNGLGLLYSGCPTLLPYTCPGEEVAQCIVDRVGAFSGYCAVEASGDSCAAGAADYCAIRACYGDDFDACMAEREVGCACQHIEAEAGHCVGYAYDCTAHPVEQSWCFAGVVAEYEDPCFLFTEPDVRCAFGQVTAEGDASCQVQACFEIVTYATCYEDLEFVCWMSP